MVADKMTRAREGKMVTWSLPEPRRITKWLMNHLLQEASAVPGLQDPLILHTSLHHQLLPRRPPPSPAFASGQHFRVAFAHPSLTYRLPQKPNKAGRRVEGTADWPGSKGQQVGSVSLLGGSVKGEQVLMAAASIPLHSQEVLHPEALASIRRRTPSCSLSGPFNQEHLSTHFTEK